MNVGALRSRPYEGYAYAYPHKTAYRPLEPPRPIATLWEGEDRTGLTLYVHVPFCEARCGYCNLFTTVGGTSELEAGFIAALERQAERVRAALGTCSFGAAAIGGGTPTLLSAQALSRVLGLLETLGASPAKVPTSVETSPRTADVDKLAVLSAASVERLSMGVQSFHDGELRAIGRGGSAAQAMLALDRIRTHRFPVLNVDLMYGIDGQTETSLLASIEHAFRWRPEEIYLYPLYIRPLTGISARSVLCADHRLPLYRAARQRLLEAGYTQLSMRRFRHGKAKAYRETRCQEEGMVGLGSGARSYTRSVHYASNWAVSAESVRAIVNEYLAAPREAFDMASFGYLLSPDERRRRYVIKTLLHASGIPLADYTAWFGTCAESDFPELGALVQAGLARKGPDSIELTVEGIELSDAIGPLLYSETVRDRMSAFELT